MDPEKNHFFFPKLKKRSPPRYNQKNYNEKKSEMLLDFNNEANLKDKFLILKKFFGNIAKDLTVKNDTSKQNVGQSLFNENEEFEEDEEFEENINKLICEAQKKATIDSLNSNIEDFLNYSKVTTNDKSIEKSAIIPASNNKSLNINKQKIRSNEKINDFSRDLEETKLIESKRLNKISSDINKLYKKINQMANEANRKYNLNFDDLKPLSNKISLKEFLQPNFKLIQMDFSYNPNKNNMISSPQNVKISNYANFYPYKFADDKVPTFLMKKLNGKVSGLKNDSKYLFKPEYNKFYLKNKSLPSI